MAENLSPSISSDFVFFRVDRKKFIRLLELKRCHQAFIFLCGDYIPVELNPRNNSAFLVRTLGEGF